MIIFIDDGGGGGGTDPFFSDVVSLLPLDFDLTDVKGKTWTATGTATITSSESKFGGASLELLSSSENRIDCTSTDFNFGTGDFTIEGWFRPDAISNRSFFSFGSRLVYVASSNWAYFNGSSNAITGGSVGTNVWAHVALCRASGTVRLFVDGTQVGSDFTESGSIDPGAMRVGYFNGGNPSGRYYDDFRVTRAARYTSNFTPPSAAFPTS